MREYNELYDLYKIPLELRFNVDETWLDGKPDHHKTAAEKGGSTRCLKMVKLNSEHITLVLCICANGDALKTLAILPLKSVPPLALTVTQFFVIAGSENGWIDQKILFNYIESYFIPQLNDRRQKLAMQDKYALLLLDNHSSRNGLDLERYQRDFRLIIKFIPPHSSALLQPLDLFPNMEFKRVYYKEHNMESNIDAQNRRNMELQDAKQALSHALSEYSVNLGWRRTGLVSQEISASGIPLGNINVIKGSEMIKKNYEPLPAVTGKRKRGSKLSDGAILIGGENIVNVNPPSEPKQKKTKKNQNNPLT